MEKEYTVTQLFSGKTLENHKSGFLFGIEIEVEANNFLPDYIADSYWTCHHDGSLRGRGSQMEYVFSKPLPIKDSIIELKKLDKRMVDTKVQLYETIRAGTHIHLNVNPLTLSELKKFTVLYFICEEVLVDLCGEGRQGLHFCLRAVDSRMFIPLIKEKIFSGRAQKISNDLRYSAMNFASLPKFGSLEFRAIKTPIPFIRIEQFLTFFNKLLEYSKEFENTEKIMEEMSGGGGSQKLEKIFVNSFLLNTTPKDFFEKTRNGVWLAQHLAY